MEYDKSFTKDLEEKLGYRFNNNSLLMEALSHPSLKQNKHDRDYERLEFLGDALLNAIITEELFYKLHSSKEGRLAQTRACLVCRDGICDVADTLNLGEFIMMSKSEEISGGRHNKNNIENTMEAIIAAIYLDSDMRTLTQIVLALWKNLINQQMNPSLTNYKSILQEWSQGCGMPTPKYYLVNKTGEAHKPLFEVKVVIGDIAPEYGQGASIKTAEKQAAKNMIMRETNLLQ